jgi:hypothetical protein
VIDRVPFRFGPWTFNHVYLHDWEWLPVPGEQALHPLSVVVHDLVADRSWRYYGDALEALRGKCPFDVGPNALWVATHGAGDLQCFLTLGWPLPVHVIDTATEFRHETNGKFEDRKQSANAGQLDMARYYRVPAMSQKTKEAGRQHGKSRPTTEHEFCLRIMQVMSATSEICFKPCSARALFARLEHCSPDGT